MDKSKPITLEIVMYFDSVEEAQRALDEIVGVVGDNHSAIITTLDEK